MPTRSVNPGYQNSELGTKPRPEPPPVQVVTEFNAATFRKYCQYEIVVQRWRYCTHGRGKRLYEGEFSEKERKVIGQWYKKFSTWHTATGHPNVIRITPGDMSFLARVCKFFAEV